MSPLKVEFHLAPEPVEAPSEPPSSGPPPPPPEPLPAVASAIWRDGATLVESSDPELKRAIERAYRKTPVVADDPSLRSAGTRGESVLQPGDLEWFRAVAQFRVPAETGLIPRFVPGVTAGGYDPAANYRRFRAQVARLDARNAG